MTQDSIFATDKLLDLHQTYCILLFIRLIKPVVFSLCNYFTTQSNLIQSINYFSILYQITFSLLNSLKVKFHGYDRQKQKT